MRRRLMATTQAPATGPKKKAMRPAAFGRHGALSVSEGEGRPMVADRVPSRPKTPSMLFIPSKLSVIFRAQRSELGLYLI